MEGIKNSKLGVCAEKRGFTLVELLVVISIIAMLLSILMPSLNRARQSAYAVKCGAGLRNVGLGMMAYTADYQYFPASYLYPSDEDGSCNIYNQDSTHPYGYLHWSWFLFDEGRCDASAFECPAMKHRGIPRTNPGSKSKDWEANQTDQNGQNNPNPLRDKQAPRMAFTANAAIVPRNKFTNDLSNGPRVNKLVKAGQIRRAGSVILATEFNKNWEAIAINKGNGYLVKSHRPITAFTYAGDFQSTMLYRCPKKYSGYTYGDASQPNMGLVQYDEFKKTSNYLDGGSGYQLNAVGRHHPGNKRSEGAKMGGSANFLYCDGHVERKSVLETVKNKEWGRKFYSLTGSNKIINVRRR